MKKYLVVLLAISTILVLPSSLMFQSDVDEVLEITIDISPNVLNLGSQGTVFTIHTDIAYTAVAGATCELNGIDIAWWKSDDRGYFVAKFAIEDVKAIEGLNVGGMHTFTLSGEKTDGTLFSGSQDIKVVSVVPKGK